MLLHCLIQAQELFLLGELPKGIHNLQAWQREGLRPPLDLLIAKSIEAGALKVRFLEVHCFHKADVVAEGISESFLFKASAWSQLCWLPCSRPKRPPAVGEHERLAQTTRLLSGSVAGSETF